MMNSALLRAYVGVSTFKARLTEERGQDLIEYAMLGGLIAIAIAGAVLFLSGAISDMADGISRCVDFDSDTTCAPF